MKLRNCIKKAFSTLLLTTCVLFSLPTAAMADDQIILPVEDTDYGEHAYQYIQTIVNNFPARNARMKRSVFCGDWLVEQLTGMGYEVSFFDFVTNEKSLPCRNIIVDRPGLSDKTLILCAHYDSADTQGCDDNASGVAVLLECAERIAKLEANPLVNLKIIFFDDEEEGYIGSARYCEAQDEAFFEGLIGVINIDCVAGGDNLYVHGGDEVGMLTGLRDNAIAISDKFGLGMTKHIDVEGIPAGSRYWGSDQHHFATRGVPYAYFEANIYSSNSADGNPVHYQTANPEVPNGQIMHTYYDDFDVIERIFPGRMQEHFRNYTILALEMAYNLNEMGAYTGIYHLPLDMSELLPETTEAPTEETTAEETTAEETTTAEDTTAAEKTTAEETTAVSTEKTTSADAETTVSADDEEEEDTGNVWIIVSIVCVVIIIAGNIVTNIMIKQRKKKGLKLAEERAKETAQEAEAKPAEEEKK